LKVTVSSLTARMTCKAHRKEFMVDLYRYFTPAIS
jgi:hypothetical protein